MTKLYFHNALTTDTGTLPTAVKSALGTPAATVDAVTVNRSMDTTIGTSQTSKAVTTLAQTAAQVIYFTRFCSPPLNQTSIAANTWNIDFGTLESNSNANFPVSASAVMNVTVYVWRPSNGTLVGMIRDGTTASAVAEANAILEKCTFATFAGSAVTIQVGDIICCEIIFSVTQATAAARTDTFYYDGTTETNVDGGSGTQNEASHLETPETLSFGAAVTIAQTVMIEWEES